MDVLLSVRHPRYLQPLRDRLDGGAPESAELAKRFIAETIRKHQIPPGQLNLHADHGRVMTSKPVAFLMADLGSPRRTAGRTSPTTILIRRASSER